VSEARTAAAVLAAGRGSRLGGDAAKPLLEWRGRPLVSWALDAARGSGLRPVVVVVGYRAGEVRVVLPDDPALVVVENLGWEEGIASSLRTVLGALADRGDVEGVCVGLADQPLVSPVAYRRLAATAGEAELAIATYGGEPGNPVRLARSLWPEAMALRGDVGARRLQADHSVVRVECGDTGSAADIDTIGDLERLDGRP
jgi:CTP:molybdopterin cytidylyltransferase MocA